MNKIENCREKHCVCVPRLFSYIKTTPTQAEGGVGQKNRETKVSGEKFI